MTGQLGQPVDRFVSLGCPETGLLDPQMSGG